MDMGVFVWQLIIFQNLKNHRFLQKKNPTIETIKEAFRLPF